MQQHTHGTSLTHVFFHSALIGVLSCLLFGLIIRPVLAQGSVEELRNSYSFLQAGLSTLAAGASVALCLARGRLDSEMNVVDFLTMSRFHVQNKYGSKVSFPTGNNGTIIGVSVGRDGDWNHNAFMWISHNTWAQGSTVALVKLCVGIPPAYGTAPLSPPTAHTPTILPTTVMSSSLPASTSSSVVANALTSHASNLTAPTCNVLVNTSTSPAPTFTITRPTSICTVASTPSPTPTSTTMPTSTSICTVASTPTPTPTSTTMPTSTSTSTLSVPPSPLSPPHTPTASAIPCTCWHIPSISANSPGRGGLASLHDVVPMNPRDPQCYRVPSYQCHMHGQAHMPTLHDHVQRELALSTPLSGTLEGSSQLLQYMLDDEKEGVPIAYFFGVDNLGGRTLKRMVSESMATQDGSKKGRTSDLVDWSLGRLELAEKPNVAWQGHASTVVLVSLLEMILMFVLCVVFGLDPFVSSLGARRGTRSLRLGEGGVTVFADLWLLEVKGYTIRGWEKTPVLRVKPRTSMRLWYCDAAIKMTGIVMIFAFWIACVFGYVHPLGLKRTESWANNESWSIYLGIVGTAIGFFSSAPMMGILDRFAPTMNREKGFLMVRLCWVECMVELALAVLRILHQKNRFTTIKTSRNPYWVLLPCWYVTMEMGIWLQWLTSKRIMVAGPHSQSNHHVWAFTSIQAGAFARATVLAAVSGSWHATGT